MKRKQKSMPEPQTNIPIIEGQEPTRLKWDDLSEKDKEFFLRLHFILDSPEFKEEEDA